MERRGQERELGFNPDSPVKLPLAPIVSTPPDRRGNAAAAPTRRGSAIFSPTTQTLDHHHLLPHNNNRHHLGPPQPLLRPPPPVLKDHSPDPDPSTPTPDGPSNSRTPPSPSPPQQTTEAPSNGSGGGVRYRECLKNHAASMGGHVVDGCGEFMPSGDDGTAEALRCAACDCHRNFHRKEVDGEAPQQQPPPSSYHIHHNSRSQTAPHLAAAAAAHHHPQAFAAAAPAMVSFGGGGAADESSSEDLAMFHPGGGHAGGQPSYSGSKKRFRTKFSQEQKDRMQEVAEKLGWRIQKQDEEHVQQLCAETGVKRQVFKVWMHNNKQALKKRQT